MKLLLPGLLVFEYAGVVLVESGTSFKPTLKSIVKGNDEIEHDLHSLTFNLGKATDQLKATVKQLYFRLDRIEQVVSQPTSTTTTTPAGTSTTSVVSATSTTAGTVPPGSPCGCTQEGVDVDVDPCPTELIDARFPCSCDFQCGASSGPFVNPECSLDCMVTLSFGEEVVPIDTISAAEVPHRCIEDRALGDECSCNSECPDGLKCVGLSNMLFDFRACGQPLGAVCIPDNSMCVSGSMCSTDCMVTVGDFVGPPTSGDTEAPNRCIDSTGGRAEGVQCSCNEECAQQLLCVGDDFDVTTPRTCQTVN